MEIINTKFEIVGLPIKGLDWSGPQWALAELVMFYSSKYIRIIYTKILEFDSSGSSAMITCMSVWLSSILCIYKIIFNF